MYGIILVHVFETSTCFRMILLSSKPCCIKFVITPVMKVPITTDEKCQF